MGGNFISLMLRAGLMLALLFSAQPDVAQTTPLPPSVPLIRDVSFNSAPIGFGTQLKYALPTHMVRQADGKSVVASASCKVARLEPSHETCSNIVLARYDTRGELDAAFGQSGLTQFADLGLGRAGISVVQQRTQIKILGLGIQSSGKIVVGWANTESYYLAFARFNDQGNLDVSFGVGGVLTYTQISRPRAMVMQSDGRIVVSSLAVPELTGFKLSRLNPDGTFDGSFGNQGEVLVVTNAGVPDQIWMQADGRIVTVHIQSLGRYLPDGRPDPTFGVNSVSDSLCLASCEFLNILSAIPSENDWLVLEEMIVKDGQGNLTYQGMGVRRITSAGQLDVSFGTNGRLVVQIPDAGRGAAFLQDMTGGRFVIFAPSPEIYTDNWIRRPYFVAARYQRDGTMDTSFGLSGVVKQNFGDAQSAALASQLEPDGHVTLLGTSGPSHSDRPELVMAQLNADGMFNPGYGHQGVTHTPFLRGSDDVAIGKLLFQPDRKVIAMMLNMDREPVEQIIYHLVRTNFDGYLDETFGQHGIITLTIAGQPFFAVDMALQADGAIVIAGLYRAHAALLRYSSTGHLDSGFGSYGLVTDTADIFAQVIIQSAGQILVHSGAEFIRFDSTGKLDPAFGAQGRLATSSIDDVEVMPNQDIIFASLPQSDTVIRLTAIHPDGQIVSTFGSGGIATYTAPWADHTLAGYCRGLDLVLQGDQLLLHTSLSVWLRGRSWCLNGVLARFTAQGALDETFGISGTLSIDSRRGGNGVVTIAKGILVLEDGLMDCGILGDQCPLDRSLLYVYDINGNPGTKTWLWASAPTVPPAEAGQGSSDLVAGMGVRPNDGDGAVFVVQQVSYKDSLDVNIVRLIPPLHFTHFVKLPVVMR